MTKEIVMSLRMSRTAHSKLKAAAKKAKRSLAQHIRLLIGDRV